MSTPPQPPRRSSGENNKKLTTQSPVVTRNGARKAKIQTRAMSAGAKPSSVLIAAKRNAQHKKKPNIDIIIKDQYQSVMDSQNVVCGATGVVTHSLMEEHRCLWDDNYPECPQRLTSIIQRCTELGLLDRCVKIEPREVTEKELEQLHSSSVLQMMLQTHQMQDIKLLEDVSSRFDAVFIHPTTHEAALLAAGSTIELVDKVISGAVQNGFALVRPPGHHAMRAEPCGYCVYNNAALGVRRALDRGLERVLLVDWDVHHGQATQQMFYDDPRVVYFSVHRYEHGSFWPNLRQSDFHYVGRGPGRGFTFNVPLNATGMGDADYLAVWYQLLLPMALEFGPELVLVSAGYDAAVGCPEGEMRVTPACYAWLTHLLMSVCSRVCVVLEGGYCLPSLAEGAALTLRTLLGDPPPQIPPHGPPSDQIVESILNCIYAHKPYWGCYKYQPTYSTTCDVPNVDEQFRARHAVAVRWEGDETRPDRFLTRNCYPVPDDAVRRENLALLNHLKEVTVLSAELPVGWVYDEQMLLHTNLFESDHVEGPERLVRIRRQLEEFGLTARLLAVPARAASDQDILSVHSQAQLDQLKELSSLSLPQLQAKKKTFESVYFHPQSLTSARYATGGVLEGVKAVMSGRVSACVCAVRPPGHHCGVAPSGFCLLNNVVGAARTARTLVLDWDVHHGDGTQRLLYRDPQVLYISIHRYDNGTFFPHSTAGDVTMVGEGPGEGFNINIPWSKRGMGDAEYLAALTQVVLPVATEFRPDLVLVSAGFDACQGDPLGGCKVSPECFGQMSKLLRTLAGGRIVLALEGGYNVTATAHAFTMCTKALLGDPMPTRALPPPHPAAVQVINDVIRVHSKYWKSLRFQVALPGEDVLPPPDASRGLARDEEDPAEAVLARVLQQAKHTSLEMKLAKLDLSEAGTSRAEARTESAQPRTLAAYLTEQLSALQNEHMFAVVPLAGCPHVDAAAPLPADLQLQQGTRCADCDEDAEVWVCLQCFKAGCGRSIKGHGVAHHGNSGHPLALSLLDLSAWCYECDAYVHHAALHPARDNAHRNKFGEPLPWCYPDSQLSHLRML